MSIDESVPFEWPVSKRCVREDAKANFCRNVSSKTERKCRRRADICKFCNDAINDEVRTLFSYPTCYKSFCKDAEHLHGLWKNWGQLENERNVRDGVTDPNKSNLQGYRSLNDLRSRGTTSREFDNASKIESEVTLKDRHGRKYDSKRPGTYKDGDQNWNNDEKSRYGDGKKVGGSRSNEPREKAKADKGRFDGKEEYSRGKALGGRGQESTGKMIHDRTGKKKSPRHRGGNEIESEETASPRGKKKGIKSKEGEREPKQARQRGGSKGNKGDAVDRQTGKASRHGDEGKKLNSREKGNENKVKNRDLSSGKKHRSDLGYRKAFCSSEDTNERLFELDTEKSALNSEGGEITEGNDKMRRKSKSRKLTELNLTAEEEFLRANASRSRNSKLYATGCQNEIGSPNKIEYQLSNEYFANLGWTVFPIRKIMRKMFLYDARISKPHLNWFKKYRYEDRKYYEDGLTPFLIFHPDATGEVFYPNGRIAVKVDRPTNREYDMYTVFTPGGKDILGVVREPQIIAAFDTLGNGIILNENGVTRLSYNQIGGIWRDNPGGIPFRWTWSINVEEPIIENVYSERSIGDLEKFVAPAKKSLKGNETAKIAKTASASVRTSMREKAGAFSELLQKPVVDGVVAGEIEEDLESEWNATPDDQSSVDRDNNAVKIICLRLNEYLSFRILNRRNVNLQFFAGCKSIRIELGTVLNCKKVLGSYYSDDIDWKSDVHKCRFEESFDANLEPESSLYDLSREYQRVRKYTKQRDAMIEKYKPSFKNT